MDGAPVTHGAVEVDGERLERAFGHVAEAVDRGALPAASLAVGTHDRVLGVRTWAAPDAPPLDGSSLFPLASISKPIVATAVLQLVDDGLLHLGEPLGRHLPELVPGGKGDLTAWQILTHTAGVPDIPWDEALEARDERRDGFEEACRRPLVSAPGTRYRYSTLSFHLLGELVARLGGPSLAGYLERRIFEPLGATTMTLAPIWPAPCRWRASPPDWT